MVQSLDMLPDIYADGLSNISSAESKTIQQWIIDRITSTSSTPLDSEYILHRGVHTSNLLAGLYNAGNIHHQEKLKTAIRTLLNEQLLRTQYTILNEILFTAARIDLDIPIHGFLEFIRQNTGIDEAVNCFDEMIAMFRGKTQESPEVHEAFNQWFYTDQSPLGPSFYLQLFLGLLENDPDQLLTLLNRLNTLNLQLPSQDRFDYRWLAAGIVDSCSLDQISTALSQLPDDFGTELQKLIDEDIALQ